MTWEELATENLRAARVLLREGHLRASVTRSYYAVYCAVTSELLRRNPSIAFKHGRRNPPHEQLADFSTKSLGLVWGDQSLVSQIVGTLLRLRIDADYHPEEALLHGDAETALHDGETVLAVFGIAII